MALPARRTIGRSVVSGRRPDGSAGGWRRAIPAHRLSRPVIAARVLLLITLLAGAACTPVRWDRPETDAATQQADIQSCRGYAHRAYNMLAYQPLLPPDLVTVRDNKGRLREVPVVPSAPFGPAIGPSYTPPFSLDRLALRRDIFEDCLKMKGYRLVADDGAEPPVDE